MDSSNSRVEAVRAAVTSTSNCTAATVAALRDLLGRKDLETLDRVPKSQARPSKEPKTRPRAATATSKTTTTKGKARLEASSGLSEKEKAALATQVLNAGLRSLGDAAKQQAAVPSRNHAASNVETTASAHVPRGAASAPLSPLLSRALNRASTCPAAAAKSGKTAVSLASTTGCSAMVECVRLAFAALEAQQDAGKGTLPDLELEAGRSAFVGKLVALGLMEQASTDLRVLKQRLDALSPTSRVKSSGRANGSELSPSGRGLSALLDFGEVSASGKALGLVVASQFHALRILAAWNKPSSIEAALPHLRSSFASSPLSLLRRSLEAGQAEEQKVARQMEVLSTLLLSLCPKTASQDDQLALEPKLSITPAAALEIQEAALEARLSWWGLASHRGNVDDDILLPMSRYLRAFIRRSQGEATASYRMCEGIFQRIHDTAVASGLKPSLSSKSPLAAIYACLGTLARQCAQVDKAIFWVSEVRSLLDPSVDTAARCCSVLAELFSLQLADPSGATQAESLLTELLEAIRTPLRGDTTELEDVLRSLGLARKAAMRRWLAHTKEPPPGQHQISESTKHLLETFLCQYPKFCFRWLGKPPASKSSTKDFVRYEQRRQQLATSISSILDSALLITKALVEEKRAEWDAIDSVLADSLTLLEYLEYQSSDPSASYHVKISNFYYVLYRELRKEKGNAALKAVCQSVDCIKYRSKAEREKGHFVVKLEQKADLCIALGRGGDALVALQTARSYLVDDGGLDSITAALDSQTPLLAWASTGRAEALSRILVSIAKLEQVAVDWTVDMSEPEQAAVLEHRLRFILQEHSKRRDDVTLSHPCVDSLLRIYYPTRFPVRRVRTLLRVLSINIDQPGVLTEIRPQVHAAMGLIEGNDLGDDASLSSYVPYYQSLYTSLSILSEGNLDVEAFGRCLSTWGGLVAVGAAQGELHRKIDNAAEFLIHLQSMADFVRSMGKDGMVRATLELMATLAKASPDAGRDTTLRYEAELATQHTSAGDYPRAEEILKRCQEYIREHPAVPFEAKARFHLASAEYFIATGCYEKADSHLIETRASEDANSTPASKPAKSLRESVIAHASLLQSVLALERGDAHHALTYSGNCAGVLFQRWQKLEAVFDAKPSKEDDASRELGNSTFMDDTSSGKRSPVDPLLCAGTAASPQFWALLHPLFSSQIRLSSIYAHLGMFRETMFFAEQARKVASSSNATSYLAQSEAWMSALWLRAGNPDKSVALLGPLRARMQLVDGSCRSAALACQVSAVYRQLKDHEAEMEMIVLAETLTASANTGGDEDGGSPGSVPGDDAQLEKEMSKLNLGEKSTAKGRKPRIPATRRAPAKTVAAKPTAKTAKAPTPPAPASEETRPATQLTIALRSQRVSHLIDRQDWSAALAMLREGLALRAASDVLAERVALATCILGQSSEQMTNDAVFSVIKDSTLAFPSVCVSTAGGDRLSSTKTTPPSQGRAGAAVKARDASKERRIGAFVDDLLEARGHLVEAHAMATTTADGGVLHRISAMLQSCAILLAAASSTKLRLLGHPGYATCSVEMARNLTWRGERNTLQVEKTWQKTKGLDWPANVTMPDRRASLGHAIDMTRFQNDYIDIIPKDWSVVSISLSDSAHEFCITKLQADHNPFVIRLPLDRTGSGEADDEDGFGFPQARKELLDLIEKANASCHSGRAATTKETKEEWWEEREALDSRLGDLLTRMESVWLGGFRGMFSSHPRRPDLLARFQKSLHNILDKHLPSRRQVHGKRSKAAVAAASSARVALDPRVLELFVGLGDATAPGCDLDDALNDLLYFVVDILQFHGERNAYDEIDWDSMVVETFDALHSYYAAAKSAPPVRETSHIILVLDKALHTFPWESLPCLHGRAVSRVPSLAYLRRLLGEPRDADATASSHHGPEGAPKTRPSGHRVSPSSGTYILNPSTDLKSTQATFYKPLLSLGTSWTRIVARAPSEAEFEAALTQRDLLLYFGHGSGAQYIRGRRVRRLPRCRAAALLMGCSSASLTYNGEFEVHGPAWDYMLAGCPAVVGTLWDVTDRDVDRYAGRLFEEWGLLPNGSFADESAAGKGTAKGKGKAAPAGRGRAKQGMESGEAGEQDGGATSLVEAVARARDAPRFRYLTAAAVVVYGIPTYLSK